MNELIKPFDDIRNTFLPAIFGETISSQEIGLFTLPIREGSLGIEELLVKAPREYETSKKGHSTLINTHDYTKEHYPDKNE